MATYKSLDKDNLAIGCEIWELSILEAKAVMKIAPSDKGSYWGNHLATPCRRAVRAKKETVSIKTAGFSTSELASYLTEAGFGYEEIM